MGFGDFKVDLSGLDVDGLAILGDTPVAQAASLLDRSHRTIIFMGSGLSEESGLSTFRGKFGIYDEELVEVTKASTFQTRPDWQLDWHQKWKELIDMASPNAAHYAIARMIQRGGHYEMVTQNVDKLLELACKQMHTTCEVMHLHGCLDRTKGHAADCVGNQSWTQHRHCPKCHQRLRPDVVWFGEPLDPEMTQSVLKSAMVSDVCLIVGTSGLVQPAASLPELAKHHGARLIEINPNETMLSEHCDVVIRESAGYALPMIEAAMQRHRLDGRR